MLHQIRLFMYELLTLTIMVLSWLREKTCFPNQIIKERTFLIPTKYMKGYGFIDTCCDCGLSHRNFLREEGLFSHPIRPKGYSYKLRLLRESSPLYKGKVD